MTTTEQHHHARLRRQRNMQHDCGDGSSCSDAVSATTTTTTTFCHDHSNDDDDLVVIGAGGSNIHHQDAEEIKSWRGRLSKFHMLRLISFTLGKIVGKAWALQSTTQLSQLQQRPRPRGIHRILLFGLILLLLSSVPSTIYHWYRIYQNETKPSPFLPSKGNYLSYRLRGVAPPSHVFQFPTPQERVQFYMGAWYRGGMQPTANHTLRQEEEDNNNNNDHRTTNLYNVCTDIVAWAPGMPEQGRPYRFTGRTLRQLIYQEKWPYRLPWRYMRGHPGDAYRYHYQLLGSGETKPMILQFGDGKDSAKFLSTPYPVMVKTRLVQEVYNARYRITHNATSSTRITNHNDYHYSHHPPIIGMYEMHRHYNDHFYETDDLWEQIPWSAKRNALIWRGASSGQRRRVVEQYIDNTNDPDIDIAFSEVLKVHKNKLRKHDEYYIRKELTLRELLSYKYLLVLEGWGMATSLKWMLFSNSVVFMAPPTKVSWAMEEKLQPYVHYVPLWQNYSNLPQQLKWAKEHDDDCHRIALQARHFMERLVTSEQAQHDTMQILREMDRIYQQNYGVLLEKCPS